jgi:hypothetical protein
MWHRNHVSSFHKRFCGHTSVNRAVVDVRNQSLSMRTSPFWKEGLAGRLTNIGGIICAVDFGTSREPIDDMESM